ncbi:F-box only protein 32 [Saguinus oedipus]|uniref:F-box only protein 32 n=1 Tax=Saguinus oedipus TaxID=9490 RepID=A0ABQ9UEZ8_SAGOE|nr:F-box only protein 32 [Saguinus oedipus]
MPFLGQDWRSPGQSWVKTADGWKRFLDEKSGSFVSDLSSPATLTRAGGAGAGCRGRT